MKRTTLAVLLAASTALIRPIAAQKEAVYQPAASLVSEHIPPIPMALAERPLGTPKADRPHSRIRHPDSAQCCTRFGAAAQIYKVGIRTEMRAFRLHGEDGSGQHDPERDQAYVHDRGFQRSARAVYRERVQFKEKLEAQHTPVWFLMAKDEGHGYAKKPYRDFQFYATIAFLEANC